MLATLKSLLAFGMSVLGFAPLSAAQAESGGWIHCGLNGHYYRQTTLNGTWQAAESEAQLAGGHLATIRNVGEANWLLLTFGVATSKWVGLTDIATEGVWVWSSGEPVTYTNWSGGEPNNAGGNEDAVCIGECSPMGWNDAQLGAVPRPGIIEIVPGFRNFGAGCVGTLGVPGNQGTIPYPGQTWDDTFTNLPTGFVIFLMGSHTTSPAGPLPLPLGPYGMPGCSLLVSPDVSLFVGGVGTSATVHIFIPQSQSFIGVHLYTQGFSLDPGANPAGLVASPGGDACI